MGVNSLRKTVTRQRRACDFWTHALLRMSPVSCVLHRSGTVQVNLSRPTDSGSTENARLENRKLFKILFKLLYLRFPPLQIRTCVFRTYIFHHCIFVITYSVLAYSILRYFRFPYLRFQSPQIKIIVTEIRSKMPSTGARTAKNVQSTNLLFLLLILFADTNINLAN